MGRWWRYKWITFHPSLTLIVTTAGSARSFPGGAKLLLPSGSSGISPQWTFPTGDAHHVTGQLSGGRRKSF
ncbi:hypothetical protein NN30_004680 [Salmonella enterica subsp. enterica serovar Java]|nr:hypothetical protein [Salmonella enterica subsp. enterica serovar Java]EDW0715509.1 hypothetical protein [Salmonella enterica subsp. enterica serovar Java]